MRLLKRWQETNWHSTLGAKVAVALLATAAAVLVTTGTGSAQTATSTATATATATTTATPTATATSTGAGATATSLALTQTAVAIPFTQTAIAATQTALVPTATETRTPTITPTRTSTPTANATQTANALLTAIATVATPVVAGTPGTTCAVQVGQVCTVNPQVNLTVGPTGNTSKVASFTFNVTAVAPAGTVANSNPFIFVSTTIGVENPINNPSFTCSAVTAGAQTVCQGRTNGDVLQGGEFRVRFVTPGATGQCPGTPAVTPANFSDVCGNAFGPGVAGGVVGPIAPVPPLVNPGLPPAVPQVGIPAVPRPPIQFIPSAPPPLLPPSSQIGPLQQGVGGAPPRYPEVPVIPESDSLVLVVGGLAAVGALALYRRRRA